MSNLVGIGAEENNGMVKFYSNGMFLRAVLEPYVDVLPETWISYLLTCGRLPIAGYYSSKGVDGWFLARINERRIGKHAIRDRVYPLGFVRDYVTGTKIV